MSRTHVVAAALARARGRYGPGAAERKLTLLAVLEALPLKQPRELAALHDHALFLRAFPDDARVDGAARRALAGVATRVRGLPARTRADLSDSGVAGSVSRHTFAAPIAAWLVARFGPDVDIDWRDYDDTSGLDLLLGFVARRPEQDGLESARLTTRVWLRAARGANGRTDLAWLLAELGRARALATSWPEIYDHVGIPLGWRLRDGVGTTGRNVSPPARIVYRPGGLRRPPARPKQWIARPLANIERLDRGRALGVLDVARAALTARCREVYAISHANPDEVYLADLGAGTLLAVIGVRPERRLSLESNYGYLLLANGVPIGYGGVTPLYRQANTGINVFEPFRGSESAFLWTQMLRAFHTLFGSARFVVSPYQFGADNDEAIASGAFWFYYQLGFRPVDARLRALAAREQRALATGRRRTDPATLRRLGVADLELALSGARARDRFPERWLEDLSLRASEALARAAGGHRERAAESVAAKVARALRTGDRRRWPRPERDAFVALAPLVSLLNLERLGRRARRTLVRLMRANGAAQEAPFVWATARDSSLFPGLAAIARQRDSRMRGQPHNAC